jgi:hypothetical protein
MGVRSTDFPLVPAPALLTRMSIVPKRSMMASTIARDAARSMTDAT